GAGRRSTSAGGVDADAAAPARRIRRKPVPGDVASEIRSFGAPRQAAALEAKLADAARAYERERYSEALSALRDLARTVPAAASVRELYGLTLYRLGRWKEALREMQAFVELSGSVDQHPVLADCERALGHHARVEVLWSELRTAGAGSDVLAEGRLVMAGSLADRGRFADAIALVEPAALRSVRKPLDRHVRQWYSLADLYERSGDLPRARELFRKVVNADPDLSDALERLAALR
ncbi:MAG: tetratricopeptide repeat protein, partial [Acidimicrobiales bacterium]